ncbi:hypothetical protein L3Q65_00485 (plasmid) [Amycolatopsis sp. FU40]|uniref:hypothetical protein n=1 Tax=Amycolatopsis sp. FU40 TaxID=2914159 RepID=UPI001F31D172|nr:hypothetical protein [Amycolatopsis sp. FU40]UKD50805.1 hypothetical protein L3Q65_00485 [Amycolatopsis sp. FU40]
MIVEPARWRDPDGPLLLAESPYDQQPVPSRPNPYWQEVRSLPLDRLADVYAGTDHAIPVKLDGHYYPKLVQTYAHAIPTPADVDWIADVLDGRGVVEVGAGNGYWAWQISMAGADVRAYDRTPYCSVPGTAPGPRYHSVERGGHEVAAACPDRALLLCWPPSENPLAADALRAYTGDLLVYVGEHVGCSTADDDFFDLLEDGWTSLGHSPRHVTYGGLHCGVTAYRRKPPA